MSAEKRRSRKSRVPKSALEESKKRLAQIEKELSRAEELKSLKPTEIMEALAKRKVETGE